MFSNFLVLLSSKNINKNKDYTMFVNICKSMNMMHI